MPEVEIYIDSSSVSNTSAKAVGFYFKVNSFPASVDSSLFSQYEFLPQAIHANTTDSRYLPKMAISLLVFGSTTSINSVDSSFISVFPNPFSHQTEIHFQSIVPDHPLFSLFDLNGKKINGVKFKKQTNSSFIMQLQGISPGLYYLQVTTKRKKTMVKLMVNP